MLRKEQNTAQKAKNNAVILPSGEEKPQSANVGMLGETFYISSIPSEHNKKIANVINIFERKERPSIQFEYR